MKIEITHINKVVEFYDVPAKVANAIETLLHSIEMEDSNIISAEREKETNNNSEEVCEWFEYYYRTMCPREHDIDNPYWRIPENRMDTLNYCPYCGRKIKVEFGKVSV